MEDTLLDSGVVMPVKLTSFSNKKTFMEFTGCNQDTGQQSSRVLRRPVGKNVNFQKEFLSELRD